MDQRQCEKPTIALDAASIAPMYLQLYEQLRGMILRGELPAQTKLPPTREMARRCQIGRVTVTAAYEQLQAEGYVESVVGAGTFVTTLPLLSPTPPARAPSLSPWGRRLRQIVPDAASSTTPRPAIDFGFGRAFASLFPYDVWRRLLARYLSTDDAILSRYGSAAGFFPLRQAVADYLAQARGVHCTAEQVVIVSGAQQALDVLARLYLQPGNRVLVETPGFADAFDVFRLHGCEVMGVGVDDAGILAEQLPSYPPARLIFVTPAHQFPRGGTLSLPRRLLLLRWAQQHHALIIEDDYDSELRYQGRPPAALQGLDVTGQVIYLGTFSKVLFPALRLGYVVLPPLLTTPFIQAMSLLGRGAPTLTQAAVADFISEGHFERHVRHLREAYRQRRQALVAALQEHMGNAVRFSPDEAGLHIMLQLPPDADEAIIISQAAALGVGVYPGARFHLTTPSGKPPPSILLGFSGLSQPEIEEGVRRLAQVIVSQNGHGS